MANLIIIVNSCHMSDGAISFSIDAYPDEGYGQAMNVTLPTKITRLTPAQINDEIKSAVTDKMVSEKMVKSVTNVILIGGAT